MKQRLRRGAGLVAMLLSLQLVQAAPAAAAISCDQTSGFLNVVLAGQQDRVLFRRAWFGSDGIDVFSIHPISGSLTELSCTGQTPTITGTRTITVNGADDAGLVWQGVAIDLSGGPFAPGLGDEAGNSDEIEFVLNFGSGNPAPNFVRVQGGSANRAIRIGADGINLNATESSFVDSDVQLMDVAWIELYGTDGNDVLRAGGGAGTGAASTLEHLMWSGSGNDLVEGGSGVDTLRGGSGSDTLTYSRASGAITLDLALENEGGGQQDTGGAGLDEADEFEILIGSPFADSLWGTNLADRIYGGDGRDRIRGNEGRDALFGQEGRDALNGMAGSDLCRGGDGRDTLTSCER